MNTHICSLIFLYSELLKKLATGKVGVHIMWHCKILHWMIVLLATTSVVFITELGTFHDGVVSSRVSAKNCLQSIPCCAFAKHSVSNLFLLLSSVAGCQCTHRYVYFSYEDISRRIQSSPKFYQTMKWMLWNTEVPKLQSVSWTGPDVYKCKIDLYK